MFLSSSDWVLCVRDFLIACSMRYTAFSRPSRLLFSGQSLFLRYSPSMSGALGDILLDSFLPSDTVIRNYTFCLRLRAFLTLHIAWVPQTPRLAFSAVQTSSLLLFAFLHRIGARWRPVFHVNVELGTRLENTPMAAKKDA